MILKHTRSLLHYGIVLVIFLTVSVEAENSIQLQEQRLSHPDFGTVKILVPEDYQLEILNAQINSPRMMEFTSNGDLLIGSEINVYRLRPPYTSATSLVQMNDYPHSLALRGEDLFIATTATLYRTPYSAGKARINPLELRAIAELPGGFGHRSRTVRIGPDLKVYVSLGIRGNCSDQFISEDYRFDDRRGGVMVLNESSSPFSWETFASGLRNPVGFDWHPTSKTMYASNNGPDHLGFDLPPEYFSKLTEGSFHGMPWFQYDGQDLRRDPCIDSSPPLPAESVPIPVATFPARSAPLGVTFVKSGEMDVRFENSAIVALHGSWGTQPDGQMFGPRASRRPPAVVLVRFEKEKAVGTETVISGFQDEEGRRWARPAGVTIGPDGSLYITSDGGELHGLMRLRKAN